MSLPPTSPSVTGTPSGHAVTDRNVLRSELIRARKALAPADWERHSAAVQRRVLALPEWRDAPYGRHVYRRAERNLHR